MQKLKLTLCGLFALLIGGSAQAEDTQSPDYSIEAETITITTTNYGDLKKALEAEGSALLTTVTSKQYKGYVLKGLFSSADLRALFGAKMQNPSDSIVAAYVEKLDMLEATVDSIKGKSSRSSETLKTPDLYSNTMLPGWNKKFTQLTWWGLPKVKSKDGSYTFPSNTYTNNGNSYDSFQLTMPKLQHITINEGCTAICGSAFRACKNLTEVKVLSTTLKTLGYYCFSYCNSLHDIYELLHAGVEDIQMEAFAGTDVVNNHTDLFPNTLKKIGSAAFRRNWHLGPVLRIPASVQQIEYSAFQDCALEDVYFLGETFPTCGVAAFWGYDYLLDKSGDKTISESYATRSTYEGFVKLNSSNIVNSQTPPMFHYRPDVSADELAKVTDATRTYSLPDQFFGDKRKWPTAAEFNTMWTNAKANKTYNGTDFTTDQKKYAGIIQFPFRRADAPLPTTKVPLSGTEWRTVCLPFDLPLDSDTKLYQLEKVTRDLAGKTVRLYFTKDVSSEGKAKAWTPYLIKPGANSKYDEKNILDYTIEKGSEQIVQMTADKIGTQTEEGDWTYYFLGNLEGLYHKSDETSKSFSIDRPRYAYYLGELNDEVSFFYQQTDKQRVWAPYTCAVMAYHANYQTTDTPGITVDDSFRGPSGASSAKTITTIFGDDDETTSIMNVEIITPDRAALGNIYGLDGRLVRANSTTTDGLPKGVYICGGKKVVK